MDNKINHGHTLDHANSGGVTIPSGAVVVLSHAIGFAIADIAPGTTGAVAISGRFIAPKVAAAVFAQGEKLVYDVSAGAFDDSAAAPAAGDITGAAIAAVAGLNDQTTCEIVLTPGNATLAT